ncbi:NADP-dependent oxidoreductase [Mycobacterium sp. CBMA271]|uniref:NADP-dependent oxidoreductase n=1 Tax=unclassified Mycobacteroides TaxID=2618759 RepID=UPI0012DCFCA4|nr:MULTISPECIES: NADP-dependent oxidoreductase [unclassified Mycobacteroides]MUM18874.1 hypothetical protein [Mycobacteroides sp. CBMA 326]MUM23186.1 NADP-dependent oxidoreductase [Mycobacteroides sp. CBMA 271]
MQAIVLEDFGTPERLLVRHDLSTPPAPGVGEVTVKVLATALNPIDNKVRTGSIANVIGASLPMVLGWDLAGEVIETGAGVTRVAVGDFVVAMSAQAATGIGTWAELVKLPEDLVTAAPVSTTVAEAASIPLAAVTALQAVDKLGPRNDRALLLVSGILGAVGRYVAELAALNGWEVVGLVRDISKVPPGYGFTTVDAACAPLFDAAVDTAGVTEIAQAVVDGGDIVSLVPTALPRVERGIRLHQSFVEENVRHLAEIVNLVDNKELSTRVHAVYPFSAVVDAVTAFEAGGQIGKTILVPDHIYYA